MSNTFYITTTLPYVNAEPHIGFGLEITEADVISRYQRMLGKEVIFNTGTDEHGQKIYQKATENKQDPQEYCDHFAQKFQDLKNLLDLSYTHFIRTTSSQHQQAAQKFWQIAASNGDIYLANYQTKYCVGCELEKNDSELVDGRCFLHPDLELEIRDEENYFFRFSKYEKPLLELYKNNPDFVHPQTKMNEAIAFVEQGLQDFSVSRLKSKMPWGIEVPGDPQHVMYVWFDALVNYVSTLGWPNDEQTFSNFWPAIQLAGKDNLRQQAVMWQAMLMSAGLPPTDKILINGFISIDGQKMSKSLGNVISPTEMVDRYGTDATRMLLISLGTFADDMDVNWQKLDKKYEADLANGLGNLCSRVAKMAQTQKLKYQPKQYSLDKKFQELMDNYQLTTALDWIIEQTRQLDLFLSQEKPWEKTGQEKSSLLSEAIDKIQLVAFHLEPFMPETSKYIKTHFKDEIKAMTPLFPRVEE
ncbi:MAG: Methionyl-tRNA synthetase (Methionine--tRNA ligase) (MetRS) [Microgenomates bacterium 39_7]|nr:MAG: Methionyl-tRNA synthetase (Methionine--tRNA ligase) (MetRS) [Microgenomates bacterium 39_7]